MIIPRQKTFSKIRIKLFGEDSEKTKALVGGGLAVGGTELARKVNKSLVNKYNNSKITDPELAKENRKLHKKLERVAKRQKSSVFVDSGENGYSSYDRTKPELKEGVLKNRKKEYKEASTIKKKGGGFNPWTDEFEKYDSRDHRRLKKARENLNFAKEVKRSKDSVTIDSNGFRRNTSSIDLAHELGHSKHYHGRNGSMVGKVAHKLRHSQDNLESKLLNKVNESKFVNDRNIALKSSHIRKGIGATSGLLSGIHSGRKKAKGEKESVAEKTSWTAPTLAYSAPKLISEAEASRQGLKMLKEAGASKKFLRKSAKNLAVAHGTYGSSLIYPLAIGYGSRQAGKIIGGATVNKKDKKKFEKKD